MQRVSLKLAYYLMERWRENHGGLSHAASVFLHMDEKERQALTGSEEGICVLINGTVYVGVLDRQGKALCVRQETLSHVEEAGLPFWDDSTCGISPVLRLRLNAEMTQTALAERVGCTQKDISRWENGVRNPTEESLKKIRRAVEGSKL